MSEPIISVSGLRGIIGEQLTPAVAMRYVAAMASVLRDGTAPTGVSGRPRVVIGRDGRASGRMLSLAVQSSLVGHGFDVIDLDVAATPSVGYVVKAESAVAGVQISASHNPKEYNGLKLFGHDGRVLPKAEGERVLEAYRQGVYRWQEVDYLGKVHCSPELSHKHLQAVLATIDMAAVQAKRFKVLLDANHGAGGQLGATLLSKLGCEADILGAEPHGGFAHRPEPIAENLADVAKQVASGGYQVGFCQDPDADRLAVIDETGRYIGEEMTLALCLLQFLPNASGTVVTNCATSSLSKFIASQHNSRWLQSAVGEANVADLMIAENAVFGGEGNGGPIDPAVGYVRDSFVGMARILSLLACSSDPLSVIVDRLPPLAMFKDKISFDVRRLPDLFDALTREMHDASSSTLDGLRLDWDDRWLLVRGSNTEPIVRLIAEAPSTKDAQVLCQKAREVALRLN